jgi:hypothetical protein
MKVRSSKFAVHSYPAKIVGMATGAASTENYEP